MILNSYRKLKGFTLVEMAIVLVVMGLLLGAGVGLLKLLVKNSKAQETRRLLQKAKASLVTYAMIHGGLPQEDTGSPGNSRKFDGKAGPQICNRQKWRGDGCLLPYVDLNVRGFDAWNQPLFYRVSEIFTRISEPRGLCVHLDELQRWLNRRQDRRRVWVQDQNGNRYPVAALIISGGERDADQRGDIRDKWNYAGNLFAAENIPQASDYDDLVLELSLGELAHRICFPEKRKLKIVVKNAKICCEGNVITSPNRQKEQICLIDPQLENQKITISKNRMNCDPCSPKGPSPFCRYQTVSYQDLLSMDWKNTIDGSVTAECRRNRCRFHD